MISVTRLYLLTSLILLAFVCFYIADYELQFLSVLTGFSPLLFFFILDRKGRGYYDAFSPLVIFPAAFSLVYGFGALKFINENDVYSLQLVIYPLIGISVYYVSLVLSSRLHYSGFSVFNYKFDFFSAKLIFVILFVVCLLSVVSMVSKVGVPFLYEDKLNERLVAREIVSSNIIYLIRTGFLGFYIYIAAYFHFNKKINSISWGILLSLFIIISALNLVPGWRGPIFLFFLNCLIIYHYKYSLLNFKRSAVLGLLVIFLMLLWGFMRVYTHPEGEQILSHLGEFTDSTIVMFLIWSAYQFSVYTLGFRTVIDLFSFGGEGYLYGGVFGLTISTLKPGKQETLGEIIKEDAGFDFAGAGLNPTLLGDAFADGGIIGIIIYMIVLGVFLGRLYKIMKTTGSIISTVFYSYITTSLVLGVLTGVLSQASYSFHLLVLLMIFLVFSFFKSIAGNKT